MKYETSDANFANDKGSEKTHYIPALSFRWLTPLYDPLLSCAMREQTFKRRLILEAEISNGMNVLDLGCGTGTLTILLKQIHTQTQVTGIDGDTAILELARRKSSDLGVDIHWDSGMAYDLPYLDQSFDRIVSSLVIHHLDGESKQRAFRECWRVLTPGGRLHIVDFGVQRTALMRFLARLVSRFEETGDNLAGRLPLMMRTAGFEPVDELGSHPTIFGSLTFYRAVRP